MDIRSARASAFALCRCLGLALTLLAAPGCQAKRAQRAAGEAESTATPNKPVRVAAAPAALLAAWPADRGLPPDLEVAIQWDRPSGGARLVLSAHADHSGIASSEVDSGRLRAWTCPVRAETFARFRWAEFIHAIASGTQQPEGPKAPPACPDCDHAPQVSIRAFGHALSPEQVKTQRFAREVQTRTGTVTEVPAERTRADVGPAITRFDAKLAPCLAAAAAGKLPSGRDQLRVAIAPDHPPSYRIEPVLPQAANVPALSGAERACIDQALPALSLPDNPCTLDLALDLPRYRSPSPSAEARSPAAHP